MSWQRQFRLWIRGIVGGFISGAASSVTVVIVDPKDFNPLDGGAAKLAMVAVSAGIIGAALYLKQHPLPDLDEGGR